MVMLNIVNYMHDFFLTVAAILWAVRCYLTIACCGKPDYDAAILFYEFYGSNECFVLWSMDLDWSCVAII